MQEGLSPNHLKKAKLMFFYTRYPSSNMLKTYFSDVKFNRCITSQLIKWFSNFREFYYIQMEKYARQAINDGVTSTEELAITRDCELYRALNMHYNKANDFEKALGQWWLVWLFARGASVCVYTYRRHASSRPSRGGTRIPDSSVCGCETGGCEGGDPASEVCLAQRVAAPVTSAARLGSCPDRLPEELPRAHDRRAGPGPQRGHACPGRRQGPELGRRSWEPPQHFTGSWSREAATPEPWSVSGRRGRVRGLGGPAAGVSWTRWQGKRVYVGSGPPAPLRQESTVSALTLLGGKQNAHGEVMSVMSFPQTPP
ncbi:Prospero homeobox protein 1 [Galemys pyrenaicus]|uniref:Prospero homeobox protein 1 n=1 Tax=Galemys pyrenaicus TaxID=202257 RepID=A0A8J5ZEE7_GALPY|nr:Prospero homeobox protein 1 [Galemys pyrenaicus]